MDVQICHQDVHIVTILASLLMVTQLDKTQRQGCRTRCPCTSIVFHQELIDFGARYGAKSELNYKKEVSAIVK
jgi:hypothetical protein